MGISIGHLLLVFVIVLLVFGTKRVPEIMKDLAKGIRSFKKGMEEDDGEESQRSKRPQDKEDQ